MCARVSARVCARVSARVCARVSAREREKERGMSSQRERDLRNEEEGVKAGSEIGLVFLGGRSRSQLHFEAFPGKRDSRSVHFAIFRHLRFMRSNLPKCLEGCKNIISFQDSNLGLHGHVQ